MGSITDPRTKTRISLVIPLKYPPLFPQMIRGEEKKSKPPPPFIFAERDREKTWGNGVIWGLYDDHMAIISRVI